MSRRLGDPRVVRVPAPPGTYVNTARGRMEVKDIIQGYLPTSRLTEVRNEHCISTLEMEAQTGLPAEYFALLEAEAGAFSAREMLYAIRGYRRVFIAIADRERPTPAQSSEQIWLTEFFQRLRNCVAAGKSRTNFFMEPLCRWLERRIKGTGEP